MTVGNPTKQLFRFAIPLIVGNLFQQLYNMADSVIVGQYLGADALGGVGVAGTIVFLFTGIAMGFSVGAGIVISQFFGARRMGDMKTAIHTTLIFSAIIGALLLLVGVLFATDFLDWIGATPGARPFAQRYLSIYFYGMLFVFLYNGINAVFNALGDSRWPLVFLIISSALNVGLDIWFVGYTPMGVAGAAVATVIAQGVSVVLSGAVLYRRMKKLHITEPSRAFDLGTLGTLCRMAVPAIMQQCAISIGFLFLQAIVNGFGDDAVSGYAAGSRLDGLTVIPLIAIGNATATYTAQNVGAGRLDRVPQGLEASRVVWRHLWPFGHPGGVCV